MRHLSFSLYYLDSEGELDTLDLTCKDEYEFDFVVTTFKALLYNKKCQNISKLDLLNHSRIFMKYYNDQTPLTGTQKMLMFSEEYLEKRSMDQCVKRKQLDQESLREAMLHFRDKIREFRAIAHEYEGS